MKIDWRPPGGQITWLAAIWFVVGEMVGGFSAAVLRDIQSSENKE